jgi:CheY-like chemotaxis protein
MRRLLRLIEILLDHCCRFIHVSKQYTFIISSLRSPSRERYNIKVSVLSSDNDQPSIKGQHFPMGDYPTILLIIEDSEEDFEALCRMIKNAPTRCQIYRCHDGDEALDFLFHTGQYADTATSPVPSLILLDLNLPGLDGREVLSQVKQDETLRSIPVVVLSTSNNPKDIRACYQTGVNSYLIKPINAIKFKRTMQVFMEYWFDAIVLPDILD